MYKRQNAVSSTGAAISVNTTADSVTTTINDTQGPGGVADGPAAFSITGPVAGDEGSDASYQVALAGALGAGENASVDVSLTDVDTNSADYGDFLAAVQDAVDAYAGPGAVTLVGNTVTFTADADGDVMTPLEIDLSLLDDALIEGPEDFTIDLANAASSTGADVSVDAAAASVTTTINDTQGPGGVADGPAEFSITGPSAGDEGSDASYQVALAGALGAGENASVDISLTDVDTTSADYGDFLAAVQDAVDAYAGPGDVTLVGNTVTFTADADGDVMTPLDIDLSLLDDALIEGPEDFTIDLANAASSTGADVSVDATAASVTTTINDTQGPGGVAEGPAEFSITGPTAGDEGTDASYQVALAGALGAGENASVDISLTDVDTNSADYGDYLAAVQAAVDAYAGPGTVTLVGNTVTFTADADGDVMTPLDIDLSLVDDAFIEGPEDFTLSLSNESSTSGAGVGINAAAASVTTTINDTQGPGGVAEGPAEFSITGSIEGNEGETVTYTVELSGSLGAGEVVTVDVGLSDIDTTDADYADFLDAVEEAVADYTGDGSVSFDRATGTLSFTASVDGDEMSPLMIDLDLVDDTLIEGDEDFSISLTNPASPTGSSVAVSVDSSVTTTIRDTQGLTGPIDGPGEWSISGDISVDEGGNAEYQIELTGTYQAGEQVSVEIDLLDGLTNGSDYESLDLALATAASGFADISYDSATNTLTYTAPTDGATIPTFEFELPIVDDSLIEGSENYTIQLSNASSATGLSPVIGNDSVESVISDTQGEFGSADGPAVWSITGSTSGDEGSTVSYTIALEGIFGENEVATVDVGLSDIDTNSSDYADYVAAIETAVAAYAGDGTLEFDAATQTLAFTAGADGDELAPLTFEFGLEDDMLVEGPELFAIELTNAGSSTDATVAIDTAAASVTTTINDTQGEGGDAEAATFAIQGSDSVAEGGVATYRLTLDGLIQGGEEIAVQLALTDIDTDSADYADFVTAVETAIAGRTDLAFDSTTGVLTYTSPADGAMMEDLIFSIAANADSDVETPEDYNIALSSVASSTGVAVEIDTMANSVTTTITSTDTVVPPLGPHNNAPPIASDDAATTLIDEPVSGNLFSNDGDPEGEVITLIDPLTSQPATGPVTLTTDQGGTVTIDPLTGDYTYTPPAGYTGPDGFAYEISDPQGNVAEAFVSLNVIEDLDPAVNNLPEAYDDASTTTLNTSVMGNALANDLDVDGGTITVLSVDGDTTLGPVTTDSGGTLTILANGDYTYAPAIGFVGTETVVYTIDDGQGGTASATIFLSVFDTPPEVEDDINNTSIDTPVDGNVLTNDQSNPGDPLTISTSGGVGLVGPTVFPTAQGGTVTILPNGDYTYVPPAGFVGEDSITLHVCDDAGNCVPNELVIDVVDTTVDPNNAPPIAGDDNFVVLADATAPLESSLLGNDGDPDGDVIVVEQAGGVAPGTPFVTANGGTVTVNADGTFEYTPAVGFTGEDTFEYTIADPSGATDDATVTIDVQPDNDPFANNDPDANDDTVTTQVGTPVSGNALGNDTDPNVPADTLTVVSVNGDTTLAPVTTASGGTLTIGSDGEFTYSPATGFVGTETVTYTIGDGLGGTDTATIYLSVFNTPPQAEDDINFTTIDTPVNGNVLTNDTANPGETLVVGDGSGNPLTSATPMVTNEGGLLLINPDGTYTYTPPAGYVGEDTITLEICDEFGACVESELVIEVTDPIVNPENTPPIAVNDNFEVFTDPSQPLESTLFGNDSDPDGDTFTVSQAGGVPAGTEFTTASGGTVTVNSDGTFEYQPTAGFIGLDTFEYTITDSSGATDTATVTINVQPDSDPSANDEPDANDDSAATRVNVATTGNVTDNDTDPNNDTPLLVVDVDGNAPGTPVTTASGGAVTINPDGTYTYQPGPDFVGTESIQYTIDDGNGGTDTATLFLTVFNTPPEVEDDINNTSINTPVDGNILTNDVSDAGDTLVVGDGSGSPITGPVLLTTDNGGTVEINPDGSYTYTPPTDYVGEDSITIEVCDEFGVCVENELTIEVVDPGGNPDNTPPIAQNDNFEVFTDSTTPLASDLLGNDGDPDGDVIVVSEAGGVAVGTPFTTTNGGTVTVNADGTFEYTPAAGFIGQDNFEYTIVDPSGASDTANVTINVQPDSDPNACLLYTSPSPRD